MATPTATTAVAATETETAKAAQPAQYLWMLMDINEFL